MLTYVLTYLLTPWSRVLLEKLTSSLLDKKLTATTTKTTTTMMMMIIIMIIIIIIIIFLPLSFDVILYLTPANECVRVI
jgi:membrane protein insertase Oxa1/YidC/SpoIIIJ